MGIIYWVKSFLNRSIQPTKVASDSKSQYAIFVSCHRKDDALVIRLPNHLDLPTHLHHMNRDKNAAIVKLRQKRSLFHPVIPAIIIIRVMGHHASI